MISFGVVLSYDMSSSLWCNLKLSYLMIQRVPYLLLQYTPPQQLMDTSPATPATGMRNGKHSSAISTAWNGWKTPMLPISRRRPWKASIVSSEYSKPWQHVNCSDQTLYIKQKSWRRKRIKVTYKSLETWASLRNQLQTSRASQWVREIYTTPQYRYATSWLIVLPWR